jgi:hypothetical protein
VDWLVGCLLGWLVVINSKECNALSKSIKDGKSAMEKKYKTCCDDIKQLKELLDTDVKSLLMSVSMIVNDVNVQIKPHARPRWMTRRNDHVTLNDAMKSYANGRRIPYMN